MDISTLTAEAAALLAGYALAIGQEVADKTKAAIADRLYGLVKDKLGNRTSDKRALDNLVQEPANLRHQEVVAAALQDAVQDDPPFGDALLQAVNELKRAQGNDFTVSGPGVGNQIVSNFGDGVTVTDSIVNNQGNIDQSTKHDRRKTITKRGSSAMWLIIGIAVGFVLAGTTTYVVINNNSGSGDQSSPSTARRATHASNGGGCKTDCNLLFSTNPYEAVRVIYRDIANGDPDLCVRFTESARDEFAVHLGYQDCQEAVLDLHELITDRDDYAESMPSYTTDPVTSDRLRISSCRDNREGVIRGGPALGLFVVEKIPNSEGGQWIIAGHENEEC